MSPNRVLLKFALQYPWLILLTTVLGFSGALFNGVSTTLIVPVLLGFLGQDTVLKAGPPIIRKFLALFDAQQGTKSLILMLVAVFVAILLKNLAAYFNTLTAGLLSKKLVNSIRKEGIKLLLEVDIDFFAKHRIGDLLNRISQETTRTANAIKICIGLFSTVITIFVFLAILVSISWQLTLVSSCLLLLVALINQFCVRRAKKFGKTLSEKSRSYSTALLEIMTGIRLIKSVGNEKSEYTRIEKLINEREKADFQSQANFAIVSPLNEILGLIAILAIVFLGATVLQDSLVGDVSLSPQAKQQALSTLLLIYLYTLSRVMPIVSLLNNQRSRFANLSHSAAIVTDFLQRDNKPFMENKSEIYDHLKDKLTIENVSFNYPDHDDMVLRQVNLSIPKGTTLALVGSSGAGKSTLADLLPRFYDPVEGTIKVDGKDLREYDIGSLRRAMGIVSQDTFLFNSPVGYNIAYGLEDITEEQIIEAAKRANAYEFITKLPKGFDTEVGDRGVMLSGGQRQRLAIARALLRNPDILILDEATSALDTVSERLVQQAIDELCRDRTTIVIAHRLSTVQKAHQIAVMDKGRVVEVGTHKELLQKPGGYYARLYNLQFENPPQVQLPDSPSLFKTSLLVSHKLRNHLSYELRTSLNSMLGSLGLLNDELVDDPREQRELVRESYHAALRLLNQIEMFEANTKKYLLKKK